MNYIELDEVDSTNEYVKRNIDKLPDFSVVRCNHQTAGHGQNGHIWESKKGQDLLMSILIKEFKNPQDLYKLAQIASCSVVELLDRYGIEGKIKWPNDIILNYKKICGILTELSAEMERVNYIVIGIGINVKTLEFPEEIKEKATSLYKEGYKLSRVDIVRQFCIEFEKLYKAYILDRNKDSTLEICKKYSAIIGNHVYLIKNNKKELVECIDINENGNLIIKENNGEIKEILSGEVSIRGVKGYV